MSGTVWQKVEPKLSKRMKVLNPAGIVMTLKGAHPSDGLYSKWSGSNYELAEMHAAGGAHFPPRNFMKAAKERIETNKEARRQCSEFLKMSVSTKMKMSASVKAEGGVWIDWDYYGGWVASLIHSWLLDGRLRLARLSKKTVEKKRRYGYGSTPLYASGELAKSIGWTVR